MEERLLPMNEILPGMKGWKCRVRVIKKQGAKQASNSPNKFQKLKLILGDGLGCTVDAVIFHDNIDRFEHVLQEGRVYMVKGAYVSDPKQYKNPIVTCNYQWIFRRDTSVMEEPDDSIPTCRLYFTTTPSSEFHKFLSTKTLINSACIIVANQEPRVVTVRGQGKVLHEYAAIDTELEPFVVAFWEDSISNEMFAGIEPASKRTPLLLANFSVVPYYGLSLSSNAQSIVVNDSNDEVLIELERWMHKNEEAINILVQSTNFFEKKVLRSSKQPVHASTVEQILHTQENTYFNVKVKARLENEYQDFFYIGCPICSTKTVATYGTEFMCYSTPCKTMRIATRSFRFTLVVFDTTGEAEVTFLGKEAHKLLGVDPTEFHQKQNESPAAHSDFLRKRICSVILLLKIKSRMFKDAPTFTVDAIEILQDDNGAPLEQTTTQHNDYLNKGQLTSAKTKLTCADSLVDKDNDNLVQVKIAHKDKGKGKMYEESNVEYNKGNATRCTLEDNDSSDDNKPISEIFKGKKKSVFTVQSEDSESDSFEYAMQSAQKGAPPKEKKKNFFVVQSEDSENDSFEYTMESTQKGVPPKGKSKNVFVVQSEDSDDDSSDYKMESAQKAKLGVMKKRTQREPICKRKRIVHLDLTMDQANDDQLFDKDGDSSDHSKQISGTLLKKKKPNLVVVKQKKTNLAQAKNNQMTRALSTKDKKKVKINISTSKKHGLLAVPQTPPIKSRSGRTIKQKILD